MAPPQLQPGDDTDITIARMVVTALIGLALFYGFRSVLTGTHLEQRFGDIIASTATSVEPSSDVIIVNADRSALERYGSWPFDASVQARLAEQLALADARAVVFVDAIPGKTINPRDIQTFVKASERCTLIIPRPTRVDPFHSEGVVSDQLAHTPLRAFELGIAHIEPDDDGVVRRTRLAYRIDEEVVPALALATARELGFDDLPEADPDASIRIVFGSRDVRWPQVAINDVLSGTVASALLADKICLIGITEPGFIGTLTTPQTDAPHYESPVAVHAASFETLTRHGTPAEIPGWLTMLLAAVVSIAMAAIYRFLRPLAILVLLAGYLTAVPVFAWLLYALTYAQLPTLSFMAMGLCMLLGSLIVQLVRYQDDLLSLLTVLQRTHWLLPEDYGSKQLNAPGIKHLLSSLNDLLDGSGVILATVERSKGEREEHLVAGLSAGFPYDEEAPETGTELGTLPVVQMAVVDGDLIHPSLQGRFWAIPIKHGEAVRGWLFCRLDDMTRLRRGEVLVQALSDQLVPLLREGTVQRGFPLPEIRFLRFLGSNYLSDITERLESLQSRDRSEREIITMMLNITEVGLVLADGIGRVLFRNRFANDVLDLTGVDWDGESAVTLLHRLSEVKAAAESESIEDCFKAGAGMDFTLEAQDSSGRSYLVHVSPFLADPVESRKANDGGGTVSSSNAGARLPAWPDYLIITFANITLLQHVDDIKSELIDIISLKCRNHLASLQVCTDLLQTNPDVARQIAPQITEATGALQGIFQRYRGSANFSIDYEQRAQAVPVNISKLVIEAIAALKPLATQCKVHVNSVSKQSMETAMVAHAPLRQSVEDMLRACIHSSRPGMTIDLGVTAEERRLCIDIIMKECTLLVTLKRFPVTVPDDVALDEGDLSYQAAGLMPDTHILLESIGASLEAWAHGPKGLVFSIIVPRLD